MNGEVSVVPTRQLDRIEESVQSLHAALDELAGYLERILLEQADGDRARLGFRAYRRRLRQREASA